MNKMKMLKTHFQLFSFKKKLNKRAYFFLIDGIFAMIILMIGFMIISSNKPTETDEVPLAQSAENFVDLISSVKISEVCEECECSLFQIQQQCNNDLIKNRDQTILDYLGELYFKYKQTNNPDIKNQIRDIFLEVADIAYRNDLYDVGLRINGEDMFVQGNQEESFNLISSKRILFGFYHMETAFSINIVYWGPYLAEVRLWEI